MIVFFYFFLNSKSRSLREYNIFYSSLFNSYERFLSVMSIRYGVGNYGYLFIGNEIRRLESMSNIIL